MPPRECQAPKRPRSNPEPSGKRKAGASGAPLTIECVGHARDRYGRLLAVCYVGGESINERMVREGWALDFRRYSTAYLQAEAAARRAGAGIWRGEFTAPWEWRAERR